MIPDQHTYMFILGNHPAMSIAEIDAALRIAGITYEPLAVSDSLCTVRADQPIRPHLLSRLGGTDRIARVLTSFNHIPTADDIHTLLRPLPDRLVISVGSFVTSQNVNTKRIAMDLKKRARSEGSRVQFIQPPRGASYANAAQIHAYNLTREPNRELLIVPHDSGYGLAQTIAAQDIAAYELRDTERPARDTRSGMLPPKLAQIMLNIAVSRIGGQDQSTILDPFCGGGTVLQEGWVHGLRMIGSDAQQDAINASAENLQWLHSHFDVDDSLEPHLEVHDATTPFPEELKESIDAIVTEPFLGAPRTAPLSSQNEFEAFARPLQTLYTAAFKHIFPVLREGAPVLFILPAPNVKGSGITPFPHSLLDELAALGYRQEQLVPQQLQRYAQQTDRGTLIYARPDAFVGRELTLWRKGTD